MAKPSRKRHHALLGDVPVVRSNDDQLGRLPFARTIAKSIVSMRGSDPFVFGLCGPWGSGKSSVLNLIEQDLARRGSAKRKPIVVRFNPWWFSGQDQLLRAFLKQLTSTLGRSDKGEQATKLGETLATFAKVLRPIGRIPGAGLLKGAAEVLEAGAEGSKKVGDRLAKDVVAIRKDIDKQLAKFNGRIVVLMDDIDRLTSQEIAQLFMIVKAVADFPNSVYLLAFDHGVVCKAIDKALGVEGAAYLEKIVQVQIDIPPCDLLQLQRLFLAQMEELIGDQATESTKRDFENLFHDGLKDFLNTPRSVKRLTNVLRVLFPGVKGEVHWPDFVGIVTLMVFAPDSYRYVRDKPHLFTGSEMEGSGGLVDFKKLFQSWMQTLPSLSRQSVEGILGRLFPRVQWALGGYGHGEGFKSRWAADLRICSPACFERYFQLRVPENALSEMDWQQIVRLLNDEPAFDLQLTEICQQNTPQQPVERACAFVERAHLFAKHQAAPEQALSLFRGILRNGDRLIQRTADSNSFFRMDNVNSVLRLLRDCLRKCDAVTRHEEIERSLQADSAAPFTALELVWLLGIEHGRYGQRPNDQYSPPLVSEECVGTCEGHLLKRLRQRANDGTLILLPYPANVVIHWNGIAGDDEGTAWIRSATTDDRMYMSLMEDFEGSSTIIGLHDHAGVREVTFSAAMPVSWLGGLETRNRAQNILESSPVWLSPEQRHLLLLVVASIDENGCPIDNSPRTTAGKASRE